MAVFDEETKEKYIPWVIEPAGGVDRTLLALLVDAWQYHDRGRVFPPPTDKLLNAAIHATLGGDPQGVQAETVLAVKPKLAAYDAAVLPLIKKEPLQKMADELVKKLQAEGKNVFYDESGSIGRRYRRQDEIGTPICYTIDFESVESKTKGTVTARDRDTMKQTRVTI